MRLSLLWPFAVSFRKTALNSDFIWIIFYDFIHAGPGAGSGAVNSYGVNFEHHRKLLSI